MNTNLSERYLAIKKEKQINGLLFGLLAGLGFALAAWGYDAFLLARANVAFPWLKLLIGGTVSLLLCSLAGWITSRTDNALVGLVCWLFAGGLLAWFTGHLPYEEFYPALLRMLNPELQSVISYPFTQTASARQLIIYWTFLIASPILGLLQLPLVDAAVNAPTPVARLLPLSLALLIFTFVGFSADNQAHDLTRSPMVTLDGLLHFAVDNQDKAVDRLTARQMHLGALNAIEDRLSPNWHLVVRDFDESIILVNILVDFEGRWALCTVVNDQPSFCKPVELAELQSSIPSPGRVAANQGAATSPTAPTPGPAATASSSAVFPPHSE